MNCNFSVTFIKFLNQSSIKPCLIAMVNNVHLGFIDRYGSWRHWGEGVLPINCLRVGGGGRRGGHRNITEPFGRGSQKGQPLAVNRSKISRNRRKYWQMLTVCRKRKHTVNFSLNHKGIKLTVSGKMAKFSTSTETLKPSHGWSR